MLTEKGYEIFKSVSQKEITNECKEHESGSTETPISIAGNKRFILADQESPFNKSDANKKERLLSGRNIRLE